MSLFGDHGHALVGEWVPGVRRRVVHAAPFPSVRELRDSFRGSLRPPCKRRAPLSPKQAAKVRWRALRRKRRDWLLVRRERARRDVFGRLLKMLERDEKLGRTSTMEFSWFEREVR